MHINVVYWVQRNEGNFVKSAWILKKRVHLVFYKFESFLTPVHCSHFRDHCDQFYNTQSFCQHSMLLGLAFLLKSGLKLSFLCRYNKNSYISLTCSHDHIRHIVFVSRGIEKGKSLLLQRKVEFGKLPSFAIHLFFRNYIRNTCLFPRLHLIWLSILFDPQKLLLINFLKLLHNIASKSRFSGVYMSYEDDVDVLLG